MPIDGFLILMIVLGVLAYLLVTCVLRTVLLHGQYHIELYDRVRQSKEMRINYLKSVRDAAGDGDIEDEIVVGPADDAAA